MALQAYWVVGIHRVIQAIPIPIVITASIPHRIGGSPPTSKGIIVSPTETDEPKVSVMQSASKPDGDSQVRIGVFDDTTEGIIQNFLYHVA